MATLPAAKLKRLVQLCGMLTSEFAGERANAAKMASDLLREEKITWADLLLNGYKPSGPFTSPFTTPPPRKPQPVPWRQRARECLDYPEEMSAWETDFIESILRQHRVELSPKQTQVLDKVYERLFDTD